MHELALAESLLKTIEDIAEKEKLNHIKTVTLLIGTFSGVDKDALDFAIPFTTEGTFLEKTEFIYEDVKVKVKCSDCNKESFPEIPIIVCNHCHSDNIEIIAGREFVIKEFEV